MLESMDEPRWLDEQQQLAWRAMLAIVYRAFPEIERTFKAHHLLNVQYGILAALSETPGNSLRLSELADHSNTSQSRLTHRLRDLVEHGDVEITQDPSDGRAKMATLTQSGLARIRDIAPDHVEDVQRLLFDPLTDEQTAALAEALSAIAANLCDHTHFHPDCANRERD